MQTRTFNPPPVSRWLLGAVCLAVMTAPAAAGPAAKAKPKAKPKEPATRPAGKKTPPAKKPGKTPADAGEALGVYARGDYGGAVRLLAPLHKAGRANIQQRLVLARAQTHLGRSADALAVLRSVLKTDKENPEANHLTGLLLLEARKHDQAREYLERAWRLRDGSATAAALGRCYYALGKIAKAKAFLELAGRSDIRNADNSFLLGRICLDRGQGALAEKYLLMALEAGKDTLELHKMLARAYLLQHKYVGPVRIVRPGKGVAAGDVVDAHLILAAADSTPGAYRAGTVYSALHEGLVIRKRTPLDRDALYCVTAGWQAAGRTDLARHALKTLVRLEPASRRVVALQARIALEAEDHPALDPASAAARRAKALPPADLAELRYQQAQQFRGRGKRAEALAALARAAKDAPTSGKILRGLATLSVSAGRKADARGYYARLVELFPDAADIDELRNALKVLQETEGERK